MIVQIALTTVFFLLLLGLCSSTNNLLTQRQKQRDNGEDVTAQF